MPHPITSSRRQFLVRTGSVALGLGVTGVLAACGSSAKSTSSSGSSTASGGSMTLRIAYNPNPTNTTIVVADKQGFFEQNGLDVKLTASQASAALLSSIGKQYDLITVTPPTLLQASANGIDVVLLAAEDIENNGKLRNSYLIGAKDLSSVDDLKGKTIGVPTLSGNLYEGVVAMLVNAGMSKTDVKLLQVPFSDMAGDLSSGTIQAAATIFPYNGQLLGEGFKDLGNPVMEAVGDEDTALSAGWAAYTPWTEKNAEAIAAFNKSQQQALAWMKANMSKARQILVDDFEIPEQVAKTFPVTQFVSFEPKESYLEPWVAPMQAAGDLSKDFDTSIGDLVYQG
ncbi:MAG: ABC transporter substrate-binding protein [Nocardioides sp.]|uniref:ABC transporter substrate-binding protein n=1 Tax=Nocardioides sp. TaxID=35761 RepID=UPI0039E2F693